MKNTGVISFPQMGNYRAPIENFLRRVFPKHKILVPRPVTARTAALGAKYSPETVCMPFKYNLGNFIEALEDGADVLLQAGGGCRFGCYAEAQERILRDLGYNFRLFNLFGSGKLNALGLYSTALKIGSPLSLPKFIYALLLAVKSLRLLDGFETALRESAVFEETADRRAALHKDFLDRLRFAETFSDVKDIRKRYCAALEKIPRERSESRLKVGLIGELYSLMEPFSNFFIERELGKLNVFVKRYTTASYLIFEKDKKQAETVRRAGGYLKYALGADGTESVARCLYFARNGYDGFIHVKPFGCMPEVNAMPALQNIAADFKMPALYLSFDSQTSETGVRTRLEAFYDMLVMKKERAAATAVTAVTTATAGTGTGTATAATAVKAVRTAAAAKVMGAGTAADAGG